VPDERELLRESFRRILENDKELAGKVDQLRGLATSTELKPTLEKVRSRVSVLEGLGTDSELALETIVHRVGRPVLEVANDDYVVEGPEASIWEARLGNSRVRAALKQVIPSVGRIEVDNHPDFTWIGTGWLLADDVVITNRHVAAEFAALSVNGGAQTFIFKRGWPDRNIRMAARIDFRRELRNNTPRAFVVREVLHIEDDDGPDFAFLRVEKTSQGGPLSPTLRMAASAKAQQFIATVGYPAADSRIPEQELMTRLFGDKYNVKRLAPGQVQRLADDLVMHDCSTLGGNSGSPIVDLATGNVIGLHFSGVFLRENRGVPIGFVKSRLQKVLNPTRTPELRSSETQAPSAQSSVTTRVEAQTVTVTIPLQISVSLGAPGVGGAVSATAGSPNVATGSEPTSAAGSTTLEQAVNQTREQLKGKSNVLLVRDGFVFRNGWITPDPAVVVIVSDRGQATPQDLGLPIKAGNWPIEVRVAGPWDIAEAQAKLETLEGLTRTSYKKPQGFELEEVDEEMTVTCHVSPDAGWPTLRDFLRGTKKTLTIGMYDFTAPHIIDGVLEAVRNDPRKLTLVLQEKAAMGGKPNDIPEEKTLKRYRQELGSRFDHAPASVGKDHQFASAYHIKVAVRDGKAFWLSSGNWQSSNQPNHDLASGETSWDLLLNHNREWHAVIENANLARQFEKFILYDLKNAKADADTEAPGLREVYFLVDEAIEERRPAGTPTYFKPLKVTRRVRVQPLLTPDNYQERALALINTAERQLLFQNQSLNLLGLDPHGNDKNDDRFTALADAILAKQNDGVDVRIIMRGEFAPVGPLEQLQKRGFNMSKVRLQNRCHTKGIVVDGARVLIGSHNWTNQGALVNRDASLIFEDKEIAEYFEEIFWFDWKHLTRQSVGGRRARPTNDHEAVPAGMRRVSWQEIVYGD
jgi:V8-like Glu-specific endopeptidase